MVFTYSQFSFVLLPSFTRVNEKKIFSIGKHNSSQKEKKYSNILDAEEQKIGDHQDENKSTLELKNVETTTIKKSFRNVRFLL